MAEVIGANSSAALASKTRVLPKNACGVARRAVRISACLYRQDGEVFATYYREGTKQVPRQQYALKLNFEDATLNLFHKIILDGEVIGTVLIQSDLRLIRERLQTYLASLDSSCCPRPCRVPAFARCSSSSPARSCTSRYRQ